MPDERGYYGSFGGRFVPETIMGALEQLEREADRAATDPPFLAELDRLRTTYAGRPTPLYFARRLSEETGLRVWLKREDLLHTGAHKINNTLGQALLTKRMGKSRVIAETGAGQHGVATATAAALLGLECVVYMGVEDMRRQEPNVHRMQLLGARVVGVDSGSRTLKDAINEAMRDWVESVESTHYILGSVFGPHPFPRIVRDFQRVIGDEARRQMQEVEGALPDLLVACVGGGSNAIGLFFAFLEDAGVRMVGVEAGGRGPGLGEHAARFDGGRPGVLHGTRSWVLQDSDGQVAPTHSVSAGLDYPSIGPEHAHPPRDRTRRVRARRRRRSARRIPEARRHGGDSPRAGIGARRRLALARGRVDSTREPRDRESVRARGQGSAPCAGCVSRSIGARLRAMSRRILAVLLLSLGFYAAFLATSVRDIAGESGFTLFDDAMISMRYARNLAEGHGLVWNPGEPRVEGITNLLWTLAMAGVHLLRLPDTKVSLAVSLLGAALLVAMLLSLRRLARDYEGRDGPVTIGALLLTGLYYPIAFWTLRGLEVGLLAFLLVEAMRTAWNAVEGRREGSPWRLALLLVAAILTRPDAVIPVAILLAWTWMYATGAERRRIVLPAAGACLATGVLLTGFRLAYYGDVLPNTVVLKVGGRPLAERIAHGAGAFFDVTRAHLGVLFLAIAAGALVHRRGRLHPLAAARLAAVRGAGGVLDSRRRRLLGMDGLLQSIPVRGDAGNVPGGERARSRPWRRAGYTSPRMRSAAIACAIGGIGLSLNASPMWIWIRQGAFHVSDDAAMATFGLELRECTQESARIAVVWAGTVPYFARRAGDRSAGEE